MVAGAIGAFATPARAQVEMSLSGFSDLTYGVQQGAAASAVEAAQFGAFGEDPVVKNSNQGFGLVGTDFVLMTELDDRFVYLAEVNVQVMRGLKSEFEIDVERMFLEYRVRPQFNLQAGLFFTPIGYFNRNLYARAWMMISAQVPDLFEEESGLVPTHTVGVQAHGLFDLGREHRLNYAVSFGNGRNSSPAANVYARDDDGWRSVTGMLEWLIPAFKSTTLGLSGWYDRISTFYVPSIGGTISTIDPAAQRLRLEEIGLAAHLVIYAHRFNLISEYNYQRHSDRDAVLPAAMKTQVLQGAFVELSANLLESGGLKPFVRLDWVKLPELGGGPYLGLRGTAELTRVFVPSTKTLIAGAAYDVAPRVRLKLEYSRSLAGPRPANGVLFQTAFAF
jgi:hypothetical protein